MGVQLVSHPSSAAHNAKHCRRPTGPIPRQRIAVGCRGRSRVPRPIDRNSLFKCRGRAPDKSTVKR